MGGGITVDGGAVVPPPPEPPPPTMRKLVSAWCSGQLKAALDAEKRGGEACLYTIRL